jgi:UDP-N-acetylglucosamine acyltransferase
MSFIHPTAIIASGAHLKEDVTIGPYCVIGENVIIGEGCVLDSHVRIDGVTKIGANNRFSHGAAIGTPCQDLKYKGEPTRLIIGDNNSFREFVTVNCSATMDEDTTIGDSCLLMAYCHIAHNCHLGSNIIMANAATLAGHITLEDYVTVGGLTAVHQFVKIGKHSFIGGMAGVKKDVPPFTRGEGFPFVPVGLNNVGLSRRGFSAEEIEKIKQIYKLFYNSNLNVTQALARADEMVDLDKNQRYFVEFVRNSERGISR